MNIAASTLILLCLLFPGMAFRRFYYSGAFSKQYATDNFGVLLLRTGAIAAVIHLIAYATLATTAPELCGGYRLALAGLLDTDFELARTWVAWGRGRDFVAVYLAIVVAGAAGGYLGQYFIQRVGLDRRWKLLRFRNYWHYLLRGGVREFTSARTLLPEHRGELAYTTATILTSATEGDALYDGILVDYELQQGGSLEAIVLTEVTRRALADDHDGTHSRKSPEDRVRFYPIIGDLVVFPAAEIKNYNLRYVMLVDLEVAAGRLIVSVNDADGDVTSAEYFNEPDA